MRTGKFIIFSILRKTPKGNTGMGYINTKETILVLCWVFVKKKNLQYAKSAAKQICLLIDVVKDLRLIQL